MTIWIAALDCADCGDRSVSISLRCLAVGQWP